MKLCVSGSCGNIHGANSATAMNIAQIAMKKRVTGWRISQGSASAGALHQPGPWMRGSMAAYNRSMVRFTATTKKANTTSPACTTG